MAARDELKYQFIKDVPCQLGKGVTMPSGWVNVPDYKSRCIYYAYAYIDNDEVEFNKKIDSIKLDQIAMFGA